MSINSGELPLEIGTSNNRETEIYLMNPEDLTLFHMGIALTEEFYDTMPRISLDNRTLLVTATLTLKNYQDETQSEECKYESSYDRKGK